MCTILIVDDNQDYLDLCRLGISYIFKDIKFTQIFTAGNPQDALKIYYENLPQYILTDYHMPAMSGKEFLDTIYKDSEVKKPIKAWIMSSDEVEDLGEIPFLPKKQILAGAN
jgi:CheY-like chemotaxis protein